LVLENGLLPKKPRRAEKGEGWEDSITSCGGRLTSPRVRFQTCAADGCERPFAWCELHHRRLWSRRGRTDLADAIPLCHFHHQRIHDTGFRHQLLPDDSIRFSRRT
jgi:hypothetical protein